MKILFTRLLICFLLLCFLPGMSLNAQNSGDTTYLRISMHIFQNSEGKGNFNADSLSEVTFLNDIVDSINHRLMNLDTLRPSVPSDYVKSTGLLLRVDSIFYHLDEYAWDCSTGIDSYYMRTSYVDNDPSLTYRQKFQTLPILIGGNYHIVGGHNNLIGDKGFIAMRGMFSEFQSRPYKEAVWDCARGLLHELGHSLGLSHNFSGGPNGIQCDECEDNGCPEEGSSNNIMDYWPSYGYALSRCQMEIIDEHIQGIRGSISDIIWNDSCYIEPGKTHVIAEDHELIISDTSYMHGDVIVEKGGRLIVQGYLSFPQGSELLIKEGGELILDGGTLGNLCGDLWKGIRFFRENSDDGQVGGVKLLSGIIENAERACITDYPEKLEAHNLKFLNNELALEILHSEESVKVDIINCAFEISGKINHWEEGKSPDFFVKVSGPGEIIFDNCTFENFEGHRQFDDQKSGIGLFIENSTASIINCSFSKLFKGVFARSGKAHNTLFVDSCSFDLCHCAIELNVFPQASISSSILSLNRLNTVPVFGIFATGVGLLNVQDNFFTSDYGGNNLHGIYCDQSSAGTHLIENNQFSWLQNGIITKKGTEDEWLDAIQKYSVDELLNLPLGTIWNSNLFDGVKVEVMDIFQQGHGLASSPDIYYGLLGIDQSKDFPLGGFGPFDGLRNIYALDLVEGNDNKASNDLSFFIMTDESWIGENDSDPGIEDLNSMISGLLSQLEEGRRFPLSKDRLDYEDLVNMSEHLKSYPWLAVDPSFKNFILDRVVMVPEWFWMEVENALSIKDPWKLDLHNLIIFLARQQIDTGQINDPASVQISSDNSILYALAPVLPETDSDLRKLNIGRISSFISPGFVIVPNPNNGKFGVQPKGILEKDENEMKLEYIIRDAQGQLIKKGEMFEMTDFLLDIRPVSSGLYLLEIWRGLEFLGMQKFIILPD